MSKTKRYHVTNTGNSVANYHEDISDCDYCGGSEVENAREESESGITYKVEVDCPHCNGKGKITTRW